MLRIYDNLSDISSEALTDLISSLPQWRQEIVMRYKREKNRIESAMAFTLLRDILAEEHGITGEIHFTVGQHGKPSLEGHPDIHFNLSHCTHAVACVVDDKPVGVDIERTGRFSDTLARHTLSDTEYDDVIRADDSDLLFTILWTKKEALLKLTGTGITDDLRHILHQWAERISFDTTISHDKSYVCTVARYK